MNNPSCFPLRDTPRTHAPDTSKAELMLPTKMKAVVLTGHGGLTVDLTRYGRVTFDLVYSGALYAVV